MNKVYLIGNLTRDPELRTTQSGINVSNFSIAVNRRFTDANGQRGVDYFNIIAWRQMADLCARYIKKGSKVAIAGYIQTRTYQANDGSNRIAWDVVVDEIEFLSTPNNQTAAQPAEPTNAVAAPAVMPNYDAVPATIDMPQTEDDALPF